MHVYTTLDIYLLIIIIYALGIPRMCREVEKTNINEKKIHFCTMTTVYPRCNEIEHIV